MEYIISVTEIQKKSIQQVYWHMLLALTDEILVPNRSKA